MRYLQLDDGYDREAVVDPCLYNNSIITTGNQAGYRTPYKSMKVFQFKGPLCTLLELLFAYNEHMSKTNRVTNKKPTEK